MEDFIIFTSSNRDDSFGGADLYHAGLDTNMKWTPARNLGKQFNTATREYCPYQTPDGLYFFFSSAKNVKWISAACLNEK